MGRPKMPDPMHVSRIRDGGVRRANAYAHVTTAFQVGSLWVWAERESVGKTSVNPSDAEKLRPESQLFS